MSYNIKKFPKLEQSKKSIAKLQKASWPNYSDYNDIEEYLKIVENIIFKEFKILPNLVRLLNPSNFTLPIFRVRELSSFSDIDLFSEHSYPPIAFTTFGRCNFPKKPVFYCSNNPITALMEVVRDNPFKERKFCISKWDLITSEENFVFQNFLHSELPIENYFGGLKDNEIVQFENLFKSNVDNDRKAGLIELIKYLHSAFINDKTYSLSATLAHRALYGEHNYSTDILMFPSTQTSLKGVNMAIHPNFVDNSMKVKRFYIVELEEFNINTGKFRINISKYGIVERATIFWKDVIPKDHIYEAYIKQDFNMFNPNQDFKYKKN